MGSKTMMQLTEREAIILRDVCYARMKVLKAGEPSQPNDLPIYKELSDIAARQALVVFDFFRSAMAGNAEAVRHLAAVQKNCGPHAGGEYYDDMISDYQFIMGRLMEQNAYISDDVFQLHDRIRKMGYGVGIHAVSIR